MCFSESTLYGEWTARVDLAKETNTSDLPPTLNFVAICHNIYGEVTSTASINVASLNWHRTTSMEPTFSHQLDTIAAEVDIQEIGEVVELNRQRKRSVKADEAYRRRQSKSPGNRQKQRESKSPIVKERTKKEIKEDVKKNEAELPFYEPPKPGTKFRIIIDNELRFEVQVVDFIFC